MILIVGLGNPGKKYQFSRHNIGFRVLDIFGEGNSFPEFRSSSKFNALISESHLANQKIILAKPQTFMNNSGKSVKSLIKTYNLKSNNLIIIHDDIDLPIGKIRIVKNRGAAGHKGVESVIRELGTKNFIRFRVGICPKTGKPKSPEKSEHISYVRDRAQKDFVRWFVLQRFNKVEEKIIKEAIKKTCLAIKMVLKEGLGKAMARYN